MHFNRLNHAVKEHTLYIHALVYSNRTCCNRISSTNRSVCKPYQTESLVRTVQYEYVYRYTPSNDPMSCGLSVPYISKWDVLFLLLKTDSVSGVSRSFSWISSRSLPSFQKFRATSTIFSPPALLEEQKQVQRLNMEPHWNPHISGIEPCRDLKEQFTKTKQNLTLITHPHVVPNPWDFCSSSEHKWRYFWWNLRTFGPFTDSKGPTTVKA